jgi:hypothetical protein
MIKIKNILIEKLNKIRLKNHKVKFVQIGSYDGISMDDMSNLTINENDKGIFIEPNYHIFHELKQNKKHFTDSTFLDFAILPNNNFNQEYFHIQKDGGGSSFIRGYLNKDIIESENFELGIVKKLTIKELIEDYMDFIPDVYFIDCEGYDHDIVKNILDYQTPEIFYFESWDMKDINNIINDNRFTTRNDIINFLKNKNYEVIFDKITENILSYKI